MIKVYYIYKIVLLKGSLEQYYYIGKKSSNLPKYIQDKEDYFEYIRQNPDFDSYSGSGRIVRDYFKKYTKVINETYIKEILDFSETFEENAEKEEFILGDLYKTDSLCLNLIKGGIIPPLKVGQDNHSYKQKLSEETKLKISNSLKEYYKTHELKWKGKIQRSDEQKSKISESLKEYYKNNPESIRHDSLSEESKKLISDKQKLNWENKTFRQKCLEGVKKYNEEHLGVHCNKKVSEETKQKLSDSLLGSTNVKNKGENNGMSGKIPANAKSVLQFTKEGVFIKEWKSAALASKELGISNISVVCNGKRLFAGGFIWKWGECTYQSETKHVLLYSLDNVFIKEYKSSHEAGKELNLDSSSIFKVCSGKAKTCGGFIWKFK